MPNDINRITPQDERNMDRHYRAISTTCTECGTSILRANVLNMKDGRKVCPDCADRIITEALEETR